MANDPTDTGQATTPSSGLDWLRTWTAQVKRARAFTQYQYLDVTFNANANGNTDIVHSLKPPTVEAVDWIVVGLKLAAAPGTVPIIYADSSASRRPWGQNYIVLRSNVASLQATLLLTVRALPN